jgi:asparagine synthetase B (glutamine-hydrolysing)
MCGIAGLLGLKRKFGVEELHAVASRMADSLRHRGPDAQGVWSGLDCHQLVPRAMDRGANRCLCARDHLYA